ncbi:hypothetical protein H206_00254 [Candidatus Electrothrix aarhusensis]|uniref:Uncharacterized protein n=1 Tax=Candidatus Electrothrix aarhusensis TaxID=1859131 RepID=A0A3S3R064_9BACT|nr:hypothetical protein H206_00254 [Candidatus Electrothrix aarhusensis]
MIITDKVEQAVNKQLCQTPMQRDAFFLRLFLRCFHRNKDIPQFIRDLGCRKGKHIGRSRLGAVLLVIGGHGRIIHEHHTHGALGFLNLVQEKKDAASEQSFMYL